MKLWKKLVLSVLIFVFLLSTAVYCDEKIIDVPYINQYYDLDFALKTNACGPTCLMMLISKHRGVIANSEEIEKAFYEVTIGYGQNRKTSAQKLAKYACQFDAIKESKVFATTEWKTIKSEIDAGRPLIISTRLSKYGHLILIVGYKEENNQRWVIANDSAGKWPKYWNRQGKQVYYRYGKNGIGSKYCIPIFPVIKKEFKITSVYPADGSQNIERDTTVVITFNNKISQKSKDRMPRLIKIKQNSWSWNVKYDISCEGDKVFIKKKKSWKFGTTYTVTVEKSITGENELELDKDFSFSFTIRKKPTFSFKKWLDKWAMKQIQNVFRGFERILRKMTENTLY